MRFGLSGTFLPADMNAITSDMCKRIRNLGFSGIFTRFKTNDPFETSTAQCHQVRDLLSDHGVRLYQATGYWQCLIHPDETERKKAVRTLQEALRVAGDLGARGIDTGPGSLNPTGPWNPHPGNWAPECKDRLIKSLRESAKAAEDNGVYLSLEGHQVVVLEDPEATKDVLDAVNSPWVKCDLDPANWITLKTVFTSGDYIHHMFDLLGDHIISGHAKDVSIVNSHIIHLPNSAPGTGMLDFSVYLSRMHTLNPDYPLIVEGASEADLPDTSAFLHRTAKELGIEVKE